MTVRDAIEQVRAALPKPPLARCASIAFAVSVLALPVSLAASQSFLALTGLLYAAYLLRCPSAPGFPPIKLPLALFCLTTLLSIIGASYPAVGWLAARKLVLFLIFLFVSNLIKGRAYLTRLYQGLFATAALAGTVGIAEFVIQYHQVHRQHPAEVYKYMTAQRITGFMGHWMNFGGQQMLIFAALGAYLLLSECSAKSEEPSGLRNRVSHNLAFATHDLQPPSERRRFPLAWWFAFAVIVLSIILNFTRGVWLGCFLAAVYLVARRKARWLWLLPALAAAFSFLPPSLVRRRIAAAARPSQDPALAMRFEIWHAGLRMIRKHPLAGVGPDNIPGVYNLYLPPGYVPQRGYHGHMHNDYLQFAAERGLPCLAAWLWLLVALAWQLVKIRRRLKRAGRSTWVADAGLAGWLAFMAEGFFEFNAGTSPVLMLFLFVVSAPFVTARDMAGDVPEPATAGAR